MATYTAPTTRTTGELISAAIYNTDLVENLKYFKDAPAFAGNVTVAGTLGVTGATTLSSATYSTSLKSTTALATPGALTATQATAFASTVSGSAIMGFGTTNDVSLMNRAGTVVLGVGPNTTAVNITGALGVAGLLTVSGNAATFGVEFNGSNGGGIAATHASGAIRFYSGGTTLRWTIAANGILSGAILAINNQVDFTGATQPIYAPDIASGTGTAVVSQSNVWVKTTSSARFKEHITDFGVSADAMTAFLALAPKWWDYIGQRTGAAGFISEDLATVPIRNAYNRSPLINYDADGRPESNRDFAIIGVQHLVLQQHDATIRALTARIETLEKKDNQSWQ